MKTINLLLNGCNLKIKKKSSFSLDTPDWQTDYYYNHNGKEILNATLNLKKNDTIWGIKTYYDSSGREMLTEHFENHTISFRVATVYNTKGNIDYKITYENRRITLSDGSLQKTDTTFYQYDGLNYSTIRPIYSLGNGPMKPTKREFETQVFVFNSDSTLKSVTETYPSTYPSVYKTIFEYKKGKKKNKCYNYHNDTLQYTSVYSYTKRTKKCIKNNVLTGEIDITIDTFDKSNNQVLWEEYDKDNKLLHKMWWTYEYYKD